MATHPDALFLSLQEALAGHYSLDGELGRGGMGIVYLARDVRLDRPVALKVLPQQLAGQAQLRERFLREARTAAKLSHPNIVPIYSVDAVGEFVFFAMAYVDGETLGERIRQRGPLSASECARILTEVGWALSYAHSRGVIHRDVKPDNILLEMESGRALVADFGIAGLLDGPDATTAGVGEIVGTAEFMSPEQASGRGADARSDLYSLGMVGFFALTGELPFSSESVAATLELVRKEPIPRVSRIGKAVPRRLARIVDRCLEKDPASRFQSADDFTAALSAASAARRDVPVAVKTFIHDPVDLGGDARSYFTISSLVAVPFVAASLADPIFTFPLAVLAAFVLGAPAVLVPPRVRRVLGSGHELDDVLLALRQDLEQHREELPHLEASGPGLRERLRLTAQTGLGISWVLVWSMMFLPGVVPWIPSTLPGELLPSVLLTLLAFSFFTLVISGIGSGAGAAQDRRALNKARRRLRFWEGRLGRFIFKLAGVGLGKKAKRIRATHRPTELQIGMAVEAMFASLPRRVRRSLGDVPALVQRLEQDAASLRRSIELLDEAEAAGLQQAHELPADLSATRDEAVAQLSEAVGALETLRLGLLRLAAGTGSVEGLTTNLSAARSVGERVEHIVHGLDEVERAIRSSAPDLV